LVGTNAEGRFCAGFFNGVRQRRKEPHAPDQVGRFYFQKKVPSNVLGFLAAEVEEPAGADPNHIRVP
jgi:hypothetical protein